MVGGRFIQARYFSLGFDYLSEGSKLVLVGSQKIEFEYDFGLLMLWAVFFYVG